MEPTRRDMLRLGLGGTTLLASGAIVPLFLARSAAALDSTHGSSAGRVLVVLQLDGGNDGLNTVVPYRDDDYRKHRPRLHLAAERLHKIDDRVGLHPALGSLDKLLHRQQLAIVQGVGYPNPNRSHFDSMAIWHTARLQPDARTPGWLARGLDECPSLPANDSPAFHVHDSQLPQALAGGRRHVPTLTSLEQYRRRLGVPENAGPGEQRAALDAVGAAGRANPGSLLDFVQQTSLITYTSSARLDGVLRSQKSGAGYPEFGLAARLKLIAQLIKAGLATSIYYTRLGEFDTHANQLRTHAELLREAGASLLAFFDDLKQSGEDSRVLVLVFSEFGRRLAENGSGGTDHGTAGPVFLLGPGVRPGLHGPYPNLHDLDPTGDPKHAIDFRQVYATVLDRWLGCPADKVLGEKFAPLSALRKVNS